MAAQGSTQVLIFFIGTKKAEHVGFFYKVENNLFFEFSAEAKT
ncbi:hypothetical protein GMES_2778 [Paraglaciecola mesophila KMM 241]|uniref:Uncharacterized protein n=1 Tax=Paraglaciecola mesophila KMM 241 TaxID=1128912 RepID=K6Z7V1_9ALTE|nr:hypothetical protein GMES_2778 [Paraglaciecola mesophila KMM 241]